MLALSTIGFGLAWWLGLYLIARDPAKPLLRRTGGGLLGYALALACVPLAAVADDHAGWIEALRSGLVCVPAVAWTGVLLRLVPEPVPLHGTADLWWRRLVAPATGVALVGLVTTGGFAGSAVLSWVVAGLVLVPLTGAFGMLVRGRRLPAPAPVGGVVMVATLLVALGVAGLALGVGWFPDWLLVAGIGVDLAVLGIAVAMVDAFTEGEALRRDIRRSAVTATLAAVLFGGQVAAAMLAAGTASVTLVALLLGSVAAAVAAPVLGRPLHRLLDQVSFPDATRLRADRAALREVAEALPRRAGDSELEDLSEAEFVRLTRAALRHYGDLGRLVANPLTGLPLVDQRLAERREAGSPDAPEPSPLDRATELKALLLESISRLKPPHGEFGTSDEWRHYNSLYFPYVVGLRPYSSRARHAGLSATARQALRWFQVEVPERTLHNWQNAAAKLVAEDLRARGLARIS